MGDNSVFITGNTELLMWGGIGENAWLFSGLAGLGNAKDKCGKGYRKDDGL